MDQSSKSHHQHPLGVNKLGKSIRKSPPHQPNYPKHQPPEAATLPPPAPQPQVYNISKSDFRSIVQQLTGSPARDPSGAVNIPAQARPLQPKPPSSRLMKIRPPPLNPISRPPPLPFQNSAPQNPNPSLNPNPGLYPRPAPLPTAHIGAAWADSPVTAYMRYLESSFLSSDSSRRTPAQDFLPLGVPFPSPRGNPLPSVSSVPASMQPGLLPSPGSQYPQLSPRYQFPLPSPNSLLPLPSPSSFLNLLSPKSSYPLLSPGFQHPQLFTPNFAFFSMPQSGILGPAPGSQPPLSPSLLFPPSPSSFLPLLSPRWREM